MRGTEIQITAEDGGTFSAYLARPSAERSPGLVLMHYICGVNKVMRDNADEFAARGYLAVVPDLFWRQEPGVQLNNDPANPVQSETDRSLELNDGFDDNLAVSDLQDTISFIRNHECCSGKVGTLGYCLGGRTAYLTATRTDANCSIGYYGVNIDQYLNEANKINQPLMLHTAAADELCSPEAYASINSILGKIGGVTLHEYVGARHAFALVGGHNYDEVATFVANERSYDFLAQHLA